MWVSEQKHKVGDWSILANFILPGIVVTAYWLLVTSN